MVQLLGNGILARSDFMKGSKTGRFGSRVKTSTVVSGPVAAAGRTGLPSTSTVGLAASAFAFCAPGKYRKIPWRASLGVYGGVDVRSLKRALTIVDEKEKCLVLAGSVRRSVRQTGSDSSNPSLHR